MGGVEILILTVVSAANLVLVKNPSRANPERTVNAAQNSAVLLAIQREILVAVVQPPGKLNVLNSKSTGKGLICGLR